MWRRRGSRALLGTASRLCWRTRVCIPHMKTWRGVIDLDRSVSVHPDGQLTDLYPRTTERVMASIIAAQHNDVGGRGIAPNANVIVYRPESTRSTIWVRQCNPRIQERLLYPTTAGATVRQPDPGEAERQLSEGVEVGISQGFGGLGTVYVFGASGGYNSNYSDIEELLRRSSGLHRGNGRTRASLGQCRILPAATVRICGCVPLTGTYVGFTATVYTRQGIGDIQRDRQRSRA